jgi:hypothetical protein
MEGRRQRVNQTPATLSRQGRGQACDVDRGNECMAGRNRLAPARQASRLIANAGNQVPPGAVNGRLAGKREMIAAADEGANCRRFPR